MKNIKIKNKILYPMIALMMLAFVGNYLQYRGLAEVHKQMVIVSEDLLPRIETILNIHVDLSDYRRTQYNYVSSESASDKQKYSERLAQSKATLEEDMQHYKSVIRADQSEQHALYKTLEDNWAKYQKASENIMALINQGDKDAAFAVVRDAGPVYDAATKAIEEIVHVNERNAETANIIGNQEFNHNRIIAVALVATMICVGFIMVQVLVRNVAKPVVNITNYMGVLASGNLTQDVPDRDRKDEVGNMATAIQVFKDGMVRAKDLEAEQRMEETAKQKRQEKVDAAIKRFELSMNDIVKFVSSASNDLQSSAQSLSVSAEETSKQSNAVAVASQQAAANVQTVASATEELSSSINEIASQVSRSSQVAARAVEDAEVAGKSVSELVEAAQKIGDVTAIISAIAEQTNLLALNATIEAARAGDAGKGFAVVASEVKNLANESTKATEEISSQIAHIQQISQTSAEAIETICRIIREMDEISGTISAAIQEQTSATQEISRNVSEAYTGTSEVTQNISTVSSAAGSTGSASQQVLSAADELSRQSDTLREEFDVFVKQMSAA